MKTFTLIRRQFAVIAIYGVIVIGAGIAAAPSVQAGPHFSHSHGHHRGYGYGLRFGHPHHRSHYGRHRLRRDGYGHPRRYYRPSYGYYYPRHRSYYYGYRPPYVQSAPQYNTPIIYPSYLSTDARGGDNEHAINDQGWTLLAQGRPSDALQVFSRQAVNNPAKGGPKVGYGLAAASTGDLARGTWAMRRAIRIDPAALHYITLDDALRPRVNELITRYASEAERSGSSQEAAFMLASLHYLAGDTDAARASISMAIDGGDQSKSSDHLRTLIEERSGCLPALDCVSSVP